MICVWAVLGDICRGAKENAESHRGNFENCTCKRPMDGGFAKKEKEGGGKGEGSVTGHSVLR